MELWQDYPLQNLNTFGIAAKAATFSRFRSTEELEALLEQKAAQAHHSPLLVLGGGSNLLLTSDVKSWVLKNDVPGIAKLHEDDEAVYVQAGAGENWHGFVQHCITQGWGGLENLSLIPGNVGASPMQNIGAYGVEIKDCFWDLEAYHLEEKAIHTFTASDCAFGYRESVFKHQLKGQYVILNVTYRLQKHPVVNTSYGAIRQELEKMGVHEPGIKEVSQAVIRIRQSKLPDPAVIGNAGSFFKNPAVDKAVFTDLQERFPEIVGYPLPHDQVKLAAGWLIESCGWKGFRRGDAGCHAQQALVLVNYGHATGKEIYTLSQEILDSVQFRFGVVLEREVNII
ncbi:UDP-N-acetylmuramate dehydrogenase [Flavihumibacter petaseus]|uniref:UDP-N-acetylenolpyruvoylglucosamine reductase n=1 Tax=Flavihumibacter petaseus NBRC 106054 TaxID=1220578 RepID=A0A0E9N1U0_9BACT|nr:UDP-N-acetylmuramate dehydrogenase [Flavihumibacter petaseus]GAO43743.1 UDP-N-acetylenolpyruvoylglucosamine reductase [Flavihumibacter petaseus NBRC 106054]